MKKLKVFTALICCFLIVILPCCKGAEGSSTLKVGVSGLGGVFNPFYVQSNADREVVSQMFRSIQRKDGDNKLVNHSGGISYEFHGENQVKYTVSINENLYFSDGTNITIDDVIFFYHFIADATYDGTYSDWYLNDIVGLKEYYFDDENYRSSVDEIEQTVKEEYTVSSISTDDYTDYLAETMLEGRFDGNLDSASPSGLSWRERLIKNGYEEAISDLGSSPSEKRVIRFVALAEAESNPLEYNPENWYRDRLYSEYIDENYSDGIDVAGIEGIKKVNDYTCTVLFNSKNINAIAELNALLVSKAYLSAEYVKGSAEKIKESEGYGVCSGAYIVTDYADGVVSMASNRYYSEAASEFPYLKFVELSESDDPIEQVLSGDVDIVRTLATADTVSRLDGEDVRYFVDDCNYYSSLFFNTKTLSLSERKALMGLCDISGALETQIGSYYTRLMRPLSIRFEEYPSDVTEPFYSGSAFKVYSMGSGTPISEVSLYYCKNGNELTDTVIEAYKNILAEKGIVLNAVAADEQSVDNAIASGKADLWLENVYDGNSCDKYEYYNSNGKLNKTGMGSPEIDNLTSLIRSAAGYSNKVKLTSQLMELVMEQAIECPLYQLQTVTVYNTSAVAPESFSRNINADGYTYMIPLLKRNQNG